MPRYQVPQFIEEKQSIIGPLTLPQFGYIAGAGVISLITFSLLGFFLWLVVTVVVGAIGLSFAFLEINGQKLPQLVKSALVYWQKPKKYVWKRETETQTLDLSSVKKIEATRRNMSLQEKIKSSALSIATGKFNLFSGNKNKKEAPKEKYQVVTHATGEKSKAKRVDY